MLYIKEFIRKGKIAGEGTKFIEDPKDSETYGAKFEGEPIQAEIITKGTTQESDPQED